jgi:hypothetical protein
VAAPEDPAASRRAEPCAPGSYRARRPVRPGSLEASLASPIARSNVPLLSGTARTLLGSGGGGRLICDVSAIRDPDGETVEALARLQLAALRLGGRVRLTNASAELRDLLDFAGLTTVLGLNPRSGIQARRQAEEREVGLGVEEERDATDPPA